MKAHDTTEIAADAIPGGDPIAVPTLGGLLDGLTATVLQGSSVARASVSLAAESVRIALGRSQVTPERGDWRFKDRAWSENPAYRRLAQLYLAWCVAVESVLDDLEANTDRHRAERARFVMNILTSAAAPTNTLLGNPEALKRTFDAGGANLVRGLTHFVDDVRHNGGMPSMARPGVLKVGEDLALTPGQVMWDPLESTCRHASLSIL